MIRLQNSSNSPPLAQETGSFEQVPQMNQMMPPNYNQYHPQAMNYQPPSGYPREMYGYEHPGEAKGVVQGQSPKDGSIFFSDPQYHGDNTGGNTPHSQIDPSPTAEKLIPGFINDENGPEDAKNYGKEENFMYFFIEYVNKTHFLYF